MCEGRQVEAEGAAMAQRVSVASAVLSKMPILVWDVVVPCLVVTGPLLVEAFGMRWEGCACLPGTDAFHCDKDLCVVQLVSTAHKGVKGHQDGCSRIAWLCDCGSAAHVIVRLVQHSQVAAAINLGKEGETQRRCECRRRHASAVGARSICGPDLDELSESELQTQPRVPEAYL